MGYSYDRQAHGPDHLDSARRSKVNHELVRAGFDGNGRFRSMGAAMNGMHAVLDKAGLELADIPSAHYFMRDQATVNFRLAFSNPQDPFSPTEIENTTLHISYTKLSEDKYEVVSYLS
jgi:hypothetical protein